ncbi:hypothetical protein LINPERPRIM_LOCUS33537 [Linum perenne]
MCGRFFSPHTVERNMSTTTCLALTLAGGRSSFSIVCLVRELFRQTWSSSQRAHG